MPTSDPKDFESIIEELLKNIPTDCKDLRQQTCLHSAVIQGSIPKVRALLRKRFNPWARDINGLTPLDLAIDPDIIAIFQQESKLPFQKQSEIPQEVLLSSVNYNERLVHAVYELYQATMERTSLDIFKKELKPHFLHASMEDFHEKRNALTKGIIEMMQNVSNWISKKNPYFQFEPALSGSCHEQTNVMELNEADILCKLSHPVWQNVELKEWQEKDFTYLHVKVNNAELMREYPELFLKDGYLSAQGVLRQLYSLIRQALPHVLQDCSSMYVKDVLHILDNYHSISALNLIWHCNHLPWQEFSMDVIPAIPVKDEQINHMIHHESIIRSVYVVPKWTADLIDKAEIKAFQLCLTETENDLFEEMPLDLKQAYMLGKVLVHTSITIDHMGMKHFISSYQLKTKTFESLAELPEFNLLKSKSIGGKSLNMKENPPTAKKIIESAHKILQNLQESLQRYHQDSFFIRGCNLLSHNMYHEDLRPLLFVLLCQARITDNGDKLVWTGLLQQTAKLTLHKNNLKEECLLNEATHLLEMGLNVNFKTDEGESLMSSMLKFDLFAGVELLLDKGASLEDIDSNGSSAVEVAFKKQQEAIINLLSQQRPSKYYRK